MRWPEISLDEMVRMRLKQWPQRPPGMPSTRQDAWFRARPNDGLNCYLKLPGSKHLRTLSDGLWLNFAGTPNEPYVDIFAIEACSTNSNLLDKRSRFAPSTHSLMAVCPLPWLLAHALPTDPMPRWQATGVLREPPVMPLVLPVRGLRVLFALQDRQFEGFLKHQLPHPHELFAPMDALTRAGGDQEESLRALISLASPTCNFLDRKKVA